jgi:hypothetical protein
VAELTVACGLHFEQRGITPPELLIARASLVSGSLRRPAPGGERLTLAIDKPALGQVRVSNELKKQGLFVSPGGVRSVLLRHDLEIFAKRRWKPRRCRTA